MPARPDPVVPAKNRSHATRRVRRRRWTASVVAAICIAWCLPTVGALISSLRSPDDVHTSGWWTVFIHPSRLASLNFDTYWQSLTGRIGFGRAFVNSVAITVPATILPVLFAAYASYALVFMRLPGRNIVFGLIVSMLVVPNQVAFLPLLKIYAQLGIQGSFATVWLAQAGFAMPLAVYIMRNFMTTLPREMIDCARVDGASHYQLFWRVVMPLSVPALASFTIFQFLWVWNDLLVALIFIGPGPNNPLPVALAQLTGDITQGGYGQLSAGAVIAEIVPVTVFLALQRFFVRGLTALQ